MTNAQSFWLPLAESGQAISPPETPPMEVARSSRRRSRRRPQHTDRTHSLTLEDDIPRPANDANVHSSGKMLAFPIPSVRPVDINVRREAGYMGINPITLTGEMGLLLPGSWGDGKEFVNVMPGKEAKWQRLTQQQSSISGAAGQQQLQEDSRERVVMDMDELRMQYTQAVVEGDALEESMLDSPPVSLCIQRQRSIAESKTCEADHREEDWVDISDEEAIKQQNNAGHRRDDSGYCSSGGTDSVGGLAAPEKRNVVQKVKKVRFDEEAIEKQRKESKV